MEQRRYNICSKSHVVFIGGNHELWYDAVQLRDNDPNSYFMRRSGNGMWTWWYRIGNEWVKDTRHERIEELYQTWLIEIISDED
jgi:hypothetical protein